MMRKQKKTEEAWILIGATAVLIAVACVASVWILGPGWLGHLLQ